MNDEIKEILEKLKDNIPIEEYRSEGTSDGLTHYEEDKDSWQYKLLDYITKLQKENEELKEQKKNAIEWIKEHIETYQKNEIVILDWDTFSDPRNLLKILGGDEE